MSYGRVVEGFRRGLISLTLIALVLVRSQVAVAWGNEGHVAINRVAVEKIPATMPRFLRRAAGEIAYLGPGIRPLAQSLGVRPKERAGARPLHRSRTGFLARPASSGTLRVLSQALR